MKSKDIMVSILCNVYNHEKYLEECLSSLVNQKTTFKYEILVHDDCSTDTSKSIIENFYKKYPQKIVPIYENENQYSKGIKITKSIMIPKIKGKYFCFCEGDDFWIDEYKLQKQYDFLETHKEYKFCVHNSIKVNRDSEKIGEILPLKDGGDLICEDFIAGGGNFVATNSIFSYSYLAKNLPSYFDYLSIDYIWQIYLSSIGKTFCFKNFMSAYRVQVENSWTNRIMNNKENHIQHIEKVIETLKMINKDTNYRYNDAIKQKIIINEYIILKIKRDYKKAKSGPYKQLWKKESWKSKIKYFIYERFSIIYNIFKSKRSK